MTSSLLRNDDDERTPLFHDYEADSASRHRYQVPSRITKRLYVSHFLSTWNSRVFEFGSVLYLAAIFPGTLLPMSAYAMARGLSVVFLSTFVGQYIDRGNRLRVVRLSIVLQRLAVTLSCIIFYVLVKGLAPSHRAKTGLLSVLAFLACIEKLCAIMNLVSVERDWVVIIAQRDQLTLRHINAQMRRIDLACKLAGPLIIAAINGMATEAGTLINLTMNVASVMVEYPCIAEVYKEVPELQRPKTLSQSGIAVTTTSPSEFESWVLHGYRYLRATMRQSVQDFMLHFRHQSFLPSFAGSLLYFTVLSFAGQMVTYLLSVGYSSGQIGVARTLAVVFEVLATWVAPWLMERIEIVRAGLWLLSSQTVSLAVGTAIFLAFSNQPLISAAGLVGSTIISRLGLRRFDLCVQIIVQEEVEAEHRGAFSAVEAAWQNVFELCSYASTLVFSQPSEFSWPTMASVGAVTSAWVLYTTFVHSRRGHLLHLPACMPSEKRRRSREHLGNPSGFQGRPNLGS